MTTSSPTDGGSRENDAADIRATLRRHLRERMRARDTPAVEAIRAAVAAIGIAEAQPIDDEASQTEQLFGASSSADVARRVVSDEDARALVAGEIEELHVAARHDRSIGETDAADTVERQADVLRRVLSSDP